jgi:hypothetical protein
MKFDTTIELKNLKGEPLIDGNDKVIVFKNILTTALLTSKQGQTPQQKIDNWNLAQTIYNNDEVDLSAEQIVTIKELIVLAFDEPIIAGQVLEILNK